MSLRCDVEMFPRFVQRNYKSTEDPIFEASSEYGQGEEHDVGVTREIVKTRVFVFLFSNYQIFIEQCL